MTYQDFINNIRESRDNKWFEGSEYHHIIPRCLGGTDDEENLIYLTYREHFQAHKLLCEENPEESKLIYALWMMSNHGDIATPEEYSEIREKFCGIQRKKFSGDDNPIHHIKDKIRYSNIMREAVLGEKNGFYGKHHTEETKKKMSEKAKLRTGERNSFYGKHHTEESRMKMSAKQSLPRGPRGKKLKYNFTCKSCGNKFEGNSPSQKYCSHCSTGV